MYNVTPRPALPALSSQITGLAGDTNTVIIPEQTYTGTVIMYDKQSFESALVSMQIWIKHFWSMWIQIQIQIQSFDDQLSEKKITAEKSDVFFIKNCNLLRPPPRTSKL